MAHLMFVKPVRMFCAKIRISPTPVRVFHIFQVELPMLSCTYPKKKNVLLE